MKWRDLILLSVLLASGSTAFGQASALEYGFQIGPGVSYLIYSPRNVFSSQASAAAGLSAEYRISDNFSVRAGAVYTRKGYRLTNITSSDGIIPFTGLMDHGDQIYNLNYLKIPILMQISSERKVRLFSAIGPYFAYLLESHSFFNSYTNGITHSSYSFDGANRFDIGVAFGSGLQVPLNDKLVWTSELRANFGLRRLYADDPSFNTINSVELLFGLQYSPGKKD